MPWSPVPKFPDIIADLKRHGYEKQTTLKPLRAAIMRQTGAIKAETISRTIEAMETLEFLIPDANGKTWTINDGARL